MGASLTEQKAEGRSPREAYEIALADATAYYGTQDGYSGAINSKARGFSLVTLPPRMTYAKFLAILCEVEYSPDAQIEDLNRSIKWREDLLAKKGKDYLPRAKRPAVREALARDKKYLRQAISEKKKLDAKIAASGIDADLWQRLAQTFSDKWDVPLCVELSTREAKPSKRGRRVYVFFGYAPE